MRRMSVGARMRLCALDADVPAWPSEAVEAGPSRGRAGAFGAPMITVTEVI